MVSHFCGAGSPAYAGRVKKEIKKKFLVIKKLTFSILKDLEATRKCRVARNLTCRALSPFKKGGFLTVRGEGTPNQRQLF
jgi:hypothetical protein